MNRSDFCRLVPTMLLVSFGLAGTASAATPPVDIEPEPGLPGMSCFDIKHGCNEPERASLYLDGVAVWTYEENGGSDPAIGAVPQAPCIREQDRAGAHQVAIESTCNGVTTVDRTAAWFEDPGLEVLQVHQERFEWNAGDRVVLSVQLRRAGLSLQADFGSVDTEFLPGLEQVEDLGDGAYRVAYEISLDNLNEGGAHGVTLTVADETGRAMEYWDAATINYVPIRTGSLDFGAGLASTWHPMELPTERPREARIWSLAAEVVSDASRRDGAPLLRNLVWSREPLEGSPLAMNLREQGTGGFVSTSVEPKRQYCLRGDYGCVSLVEVPLAVRAGRHDEVPDGTPLDIEWSYTRPVGGGGSTQIPLPDPWLVPPQPKGQGSISGWLTYDRIRQTGAENPSGSRHPQYGSLLEHIETWPVAWAVVEIADKCGHTYTTRSRGDGAFHRYVPLECDDDEYFVTVKARAVYDYFDVAVVNPNTGVVHENVLDPVKLVANEQTWIPTEHYATASPDYGAMAVLAMGVRFQLWAKNWLVGAGKTNNMPRLEYRYLDGWCPNTQPTSSYSKDNEAVSVCSSWGLPDYVAENRDERDEFALSHESFHWFQHMFMARLDGNGASSPQQAGGFGEGFATMMPGVKDGTAWWFQSIGSNVQSELLDYQGTHRQDDSDIWRPALPTDLWVEVLDKGSGGWSWRMLWDFHDGLENEPASVFTRLDSQGLVDPQNPVFDDYGIGLDLTGAGNGFKDVIVNYLGGNHMPGNLPADPEDEFYMDNRGWEGIDMTEMIDGLICRGHVSTDADMNDLMYLVDTVMDFRDYDPSEAPISCP